MVDEVENVRIETIPPTSEDQMVEKERFKINLSDYAKSVVDRKGL